jgi:autotransporter-associated beta strand protein
VRTHLPARGRRGWRAVALVALLAAAISILPRSASAQSFTWGGTGSTTNTGEYTLNTNWSTPPGAPLLPGESAIFANTGTTAVTVTGAPIAPDSWTFNANSKSFSISGTGVDFSLAGANGGVINKANSGQSISISNKIGESVAGVQVQQLGASTLTLSGANTYSGGTTIAAGTLVAAHQTAGNIDALGVPTSAITMTGGTLQFAVNGALANAITLASGTGTISAGSKTVTINGALSANANTVLQLGKSGDTGALVLVGAGGTADATAALVIAGGTVRDGGSAGITSLTFSAASTTVNAGATLDFNDSNNQAIHNLNGAGSVKMGNAAGDFLTLGADGGTSQTFSGTISGTHGQVEIVTALGGGFGTTVLTGANTYSGGTFICSCGSLQLGDATHSGSIVGAVVNDGLFSVFNANTTGITSITNNGGEVGFLNATSASSARIINNGGDVVFLNTSSAGTAQISNFGGGVFFVDASTAGSAKISNFGGFVEFGTPHGADTSTAGNATIDNNFGGATAFIASSNAGSATITNHHFGVTEFDEQSSAASATIVNYDRGLTSFGTPFGADKPTAGNAMITNNSGGETDFNAFSNAGSAIITTNSGGATYFYDNSDGYKAQFITNGTGFVDFSESVGPNGDGRISAGSIAGSGFYYIGGGNTLVVGGNNLSTTVSGVIADNNPCGCTRGAASLEKVGTGILTLSGINTYTGTTTVFGGFLDIEGSIASSSLTTVNAGGALTGAGIVGNTTIASGGIFLPGNGPPGSSMTVAGNLAFQSGALYLVTLNSTASTFANVTGTAALGGTVGAAFAPGGTVMKQYMILSAAGGVSGAFAGVGLAGSGGLVPTLSYDANHAYLNFALDFGATTPGLNVNQRNVGAALTNFFNANGGIPALFATLTPGGLTQASGELATGSQQATFDAMNLFLGLLTDPFVAGRDGAPAAGPSAPSGYASTQASGAARDAYAMFTKAPLATTYDPRWSVWAAGYGGSQTTDGNAALGSNTATSSIYGTAVGADYRISPFTVAGFALAGGGTSFAVAGSGSGHSDLFQAGAFVRHTVGAAYVSAALAYGWQDITTNRTVTVSGVDQLQARFNANAFSGRLEGGYRFVAPWVGGIGITPYAAAQFTTFDLPAYTEQAIAGSNAFALGYNAKDVTDSRSELGIRADKSFAMPGGILTLRGRLAWAHDYDPDRSIAATFQTLPGASFVVNGAGLASDSALTTASLEMKWLNGWSAAATFEGEYSNVTSSYAGKGVVRYQW